MVTLKFAPKQSLKLAPKQCCCGGGNAVPMGSVTPPPSPTHTLGQQLAVGVPSHLKGNMAEMIVPLHP